MWNPFKKQQISSQENHNISSQNVNDPLAGFSIALGGDVPERQQMIGEYIKRLMVEGKLKTVLEKYSGDWIAEYNAAFADFYFRHGPEIENGNFSSDKLGFLQRNPEPFTTSIPNGKDFISEDINEALDHKLVDNALKYSKVLHPVGQGRDSVSQRGEKIVAQAIQHGRKNQQDYKTVSGMANCIKDVLSGPEQRDVTAKNNLNQFLDPNKDLKRDTLSYSK